MKTSLKEYKIVIKLTKTTQSFLIFLITILFLIFFVSLGLATEQMMIKKEPETIIDLLDKIANNINDNKKKIKIINKKSILINSITNKNKIIFNDYLINKKIIRKKEIDPVGKLIQKTADLKKDTEILKQINEQFLYNTKNIFNIYYNLPTGWPTKRKKITSKYGWRRKPLNFLNLRIYQMHNGIDLAGGKGNKIYATAPGQVIYKKNWHIKDKGYGRYLIIKHAYGFFTIYTHCNKILVKRWQKITKGQPIATIGSTGHSTGPHLHYELGTAYQKYIFHPMEINTINPLQFINWKWKWLK